MMKDNESTTNIEALNNEYTKKLQKKIRKLKKETQEKYADEESVCERQYSWPNA